MTATAGVAAKFSMLVDGLGRVDSSVLVVIDDDHSACCSVLWDPRKAYRSLAAKMQLLSLVADAPPARNQFKGKGSFETILVPGFGLRVLCPKSRKRIP